MEETQNIFSQLLQVQSEIEKASTDTQNPFFHSKYADYNSIMGVAKPVLNKNGLFVVHKDDYKEGQYGISTVIFNESGENIDCFVPVMTTKQNDPQSLGSAITYARRYGLSALLAIQTEDDDGNKASDNKLRDAGFSEKPVGSNKVLCKDCKAEMKYQKKRKKDSNVVYGAYFCPNQSFNDKDHHKMFGYEVLSEDVNLDEFQG